ncbi:MAG: DUF4019 domain-containing protein [Burkholderiales bacterium]
MKLALVPLFAAFVGSACAQTMMPAQREALNAAERWLVPVDAQRYGDAWAMAAETFKAKVPRDGFRDGIAKIRKEYGKVENRVGERMAFRGEVPAPDQADAQAKPGAEVSILFDTTFAGSRKAQEEITMVLEKDGVWRVAGYYIK